MMEAAFAHVTHRFVRRVFEAQFSSDCGAVLQRGGTSGLDPRSHGLNHEGAVGEDRSWTTLQRVMGRVSVAT